MVVLVISWIEFDGLGQQIEAIVMGFGLGVREGQRFQCGGIFTIRGYEQASLGPSIPVGASRDPASSLSYYTIGGNKELIVNFEVEFPILKAMGIKGVVFFDAGNAFDDTEWPNPLNFVILCSAPLMAFR